MSEKDLRTFSADTASELNILGHDSNALGVDSTQVGILEKTNKVSFGGFLEGQDGRSLESKIGLEILGDLTDKTLEGQLADEKVGGLLVPSDLTKGDGSGSVTVGLLDSSGGGGRLTSCLGGELLSGSLSSGGLAGGLLGTGHFVLLAFLTIHQIQKELLFSIEVWKAHTSQLLVAGVSAAAAAAAAVKITTERGGAVYFRGPRVIAPFPGD